ncbi:MAG: GNAT family N-acetyltransferase [Rhizobiales bacterium]|nr:GNAT family N-acetyltransferase [Hyphomicrobiales bacterium]
MTRTLARFIPRRRARVAQAMVPANAGSPPRARERNRLSNRFRRFLPRQRAEAPRVYSRRGDLEVRLATATHEVRASQALRYRVFYREMSARAGARARVTRRDRDQFDRICDHMLVVDHGAKKRGVPLLRGSNGRVVATYRLLPQHVANNHGGFYTQDEYDLEPLIARHPERNFLELGRSCVLKPYRTKSTIELLWHGVWGYIREHKFDAMVGCASLEGTDPEALALPLSFLHHHASAPPEWMVRAHPHRHVEMNRIAKEDIDFKAAMKSLPPLIKGYLRLGAVIGDGAVVDYQFGTTDVIVIMPLEMINTKYFAHFGAPDDPVGDN